jgi:hypothetical protein
MILLIFSSWVAGITALSYHNHLYFYVHHTALKNWFITVSPK